MLTLRGAERFRSGYASAVRKPIVVVIAVLVAGFFSWPSPDQAAAVSLEGLWARTDGDLPEHGVRFYYFHTGGKGLYRYGRKHLNTTESFDWKVDGDRLGLRFRRTGETHSVGFSVEGDVLTLHDDPREPHATRYRKKRGPMRGGGDDLGRMWTHVETYVDKSYRFRIYQLHEPDESGRGIGWFHDGDYDNWSTESLDYRIADGRMTLRFHERDESHTTEITRGTKKGQRTITLTNDPRNYWQRRTYADAGRSFDLIRTVAADALWSAP
jgi:hypothetical protein